MSAVDPSRRPADVHPPDEPRRSEPRQDGARPPQVAPPPARVGALDVRTFASRIAGGEPPDVVDVREPWEWDIARIEGSRLVSLGNFARESVAWERTREIVVYCHHGARSLAAANY